MPGTRTSAIVKYHDNFSAQRMAWKDMLIGLENSIIGSNSPAMGSVNIGSYITVCTNNSDYICIGKVIKLELDEYTISVWERSGGCRWKYNFKVEWLTPIINLTPLIKITLKEICDYSGVNYRRFFHPICHSSDYRGVVEKLLENIM